MQNEVLSLKTEAFSMQNETADGPALHPGAKRKPDKERVNSRPRMTWNVGAPSKMTHYRPAR